MSTREPPTKRSKTRKRHRSRSSGNQHTHTPNSHDGSIDGSHNIADEAIPTPSTIKLPLAGIIVAISTLVDVVKKNSQQQQQQQQRHDDEDDDHHDCDDTQDHTNRPPVVATSYKTIRKLALALGATVSSQVHKRVAALLCTTNSLVQQPQDESELSGTTKTMTAMPTQRVRKAIKFNVPLIQVQWLYDCQTEGKYLPWTDYEIDKSLVTVKSRNDTDAKPTNNTNSNKNSNNNSDCNGSVGSDELPDTGWTPAQDLGCCCACHETDEEGTTVPSASVSCPWCADCSINRVAAESKKRTEGRETHTTF
jgi:BRCA1 C Terminus (BRCT) domain